jgi:hypothetical protein
MFQTILKSKSSADLKSRTANLFIIFVCSLLMNISKNERTVSSVHYICSFTSNERHIIMNKIDNQMRITGALDQLKAQTGVIGLWKEGNAANDGIIVLKVDGHQVAFHVEAKHEVGMYEANLLLKKIKKNEPAIVVADRILPGARTMLRNNGVAYLEANGNLFIRHKGLHLLIDTHLTAKKEKPATNRAFTKTGLKAVFHLLNDRQAINRTYRQFATETGIALGNIKYIMDGLREAGFILDINDKVIQLKNVPELLQRWIAGYRETLKPALLKGTYRFWAKENYAHWEQLDTGALSIFWGGEPAAEIMTQYLRAQQLTIYTAENNQWMHDLKMIPGEGGDIAVYKKFWLQDYGQQPGLVPPLLVYADLLITEDPRCMETAKMIYDKTLKDGFERN